jgi:hypothetical protein
MLCCEFFAFDFQTRIWWICIFLICFFGMFAWGGGSGILPIRLVGNTSGEGTR